MNYKILTETDFETVKYETSLCEKTNEKSMYINGITLQSNTRNRNNRIYPEQTLDEAINNYINDTNQIGMTMEGCLKHPDINAHTIDEKEISHRFIELKKDGNNWYSKALILNTPNGQIVKNLMEGGVKLGISSRCLGKVKLSDNINIVQPGLKVVTPGDIVHRPSCQNALIDAIYENKVWIFENGELVEKDISEELDTYKKMINKTTKKDRAIVFEKIITDYFKKIKIG